MEVAAFVALVVVAYMHLIRFSARQPIRWGPFPGLSLADFYRVADTVMFEGHL